MKKDGYVVGHAYYSPTMMQFRIMFLCYVFDADRSYWSSDIYDPNVLLFADEETAKTYADSVGDFVYYRMEHYLSKEGLV